MNQWLFGLFGVEHFDDLAEHLRDQALEGLDENNIHHFHHALCLHLPADQRPRLPDELLLEYDQTLVGITAQLNQTRLARDDTPIVWKYFQYLALLATEIYLNAYFQDPEALRSELNERIATFNATVPAVDRLAPFDEDVEAWRQLNKVAFWMATGSGKTLLMHTHLLQYRRLVDAHGHGERLNRIILLTPNEGLSAQHLREFARSGIDAELFQRDSRGLFAGRAVEILEVTKLREDMGEKTVAVDAFEDNNLVLVDEGHRGTSSGGEGAWVTYRNALCEKGFSFEYSATFGQAVKNDLDLIDTYARSTVFDYSYRWFYNDGFGKAYQILNLAEDSNTEWVQTYLTASLLAFFQQQLLYREQGQALRPFNLERPLWVFVGGSVTATLAARDASDIIEILRFLDTYVADRPTSIERIRRVLNEGLTNSKGTNIFEGRFKYLNISGLTPAEIFDQTLDDLFNARAGGVLHVENLLGAQGEVALRLGDNDPFGVINVGDDAKLVKLCDEHGLATAEREFAGSLFAELERPESRITLLIGSKKFTEGWSSWRVSTMGLMNIGRGEGAQIIQLFGRGVRIKGYGSPFSLKRSERADLPPTLAVPNHIEILETLNIFGVRANYMAQFRDVLQDEGLRSDRRVVVPLPIRKTLDARELKTIRLADTINGVKTDFADAFQQLGPVPAISEPHSYFQAHPITLNWYPKIGALRSGEEDDATILATRDQGHLTASHVAFLDLDDLFLELERFKSERGWHNLNVSRERLASLLTDSSWYILQIPADQLALDSFAKVRVWQEVALALVKKYTQRCYAYCKREWELPHLEYRRLEQDDPNLLGAGATPGDAYYRILVEESQDEILKKLQELRQSVEAQQSPPWTFRGMRAVWFGRHLYEPLLSADRKVVDISPLPLNRGERTFVDDLRACYENEPVIFKNRQLFLLRNLTRGRGVGFFEEGGFYPDFILWLVTGGRQDIAFVDPKGIRNVGLNDPKIQFYKTIKEIEAKLGDPSVALHSFIVSNTPSHTVARLWGVDKAAMNKLNILFQTEDHDTYIKDMFQVIAPSP